MERPDIIEKRLFNCPDCNYSAQVFGETYFDSGCHNYMATFECSDCMTLSEGLISQINMNEDTFEAHHGLANDFECLRCGNKNSKVWNKGDGKCPKCSSKMHYEVVGTIKVKF